MLFRSSIYKEYLKESPSSRPIAVAVPVNLRPYFESVTTRNFFVMVSAVYAADRTGESFDRILELVTMSLREQITKEHLEELFSYNVSNQKNIFLRSVPMFIKVLAMRFVYRSSARANTSTLTNIGAFQVQKEYDDVCHLLGGDIAQGDLGLHPPTISLGSWLRQRPDHYTKIGRASCRERVCLYV